MHIFFNRQPFVAARGPYTSSPTDRSEQLEFWPPAVSLGVTSFVVSLLADVGSALPSGAGAGIILKLLVLSKQPVFWLINMDCYYPAKLRR